MKGKVFKYGDNVDTDVIIPARYLNIADVAELSTHCMEDIDKDFTKSVKVNDIIVAGDNFGCGSSREHAPLTIKENKVQCVIAKSFARIFYRNAINIGLPIIECEHTDEIDNGDTLNIDFENGIIHVKKQLSLPRNKGGGGKCYWSTLKNGKSRIVLPAPFVMDVLRHHKAVQASQKLAAGPLWDEGDFPNLVFTHPNGYHYIQPTIWKEFQKILKKAGLQHYRVHDLRHTFAVNSIKAGDDIKTLQENMGHYSAAFTLDKYGHVVDEMRKASSERMQKLIDSMSM